MPVLQHRPPRLPEETAGYPIRECHSGRDLTRDADNSLSTEEKNHLEFEVLSDRGNKVAQAYGVAYKVPGVIAKQSKARLTKYNGDDSGTLPLGVTYVIDREGIIRYAFVDSDYRKRAEPSDVLAALRGLKK